MKKSKRIKILCSSLLILFSFIATNNIYAIPTDITTIDLTDLSTGEEVSHDCNKYLETKYDKNNHWKVCTVCQKTFNIESHSISSYWTMGESCSSSNVEIHSCNCGYNYKTNNNREHTNLSNLKTHYPGYNHYKSCNSCGDIVGQTSCTKEDGSIIGCNNLGTCNVCKYIYKAPNHQSFIRNGNGVITCDSCKTTLGTINDFGLSYDNSKLNIKYKLTPSFNYTQEPSLANYNYRRDFLTINNHISIKKENYYDVELNADIITKDEVSDSLESSHFFQLDNGGIIRLVVINVVSPDKISPIINEIQQTDLSTSNGWATSKQITISGTENFCNSVKITVTDNEGNCYLNEGLATVVNNQYSYSFIPDVEADINGKEFIVNISDTFNNVSNKTFIIYKTDKKFPKMISPEETDTIWTKQKKFTFESTDQGIGNVSIAFNNISDYKQANLIDNIYNREYLFTGDVYGFVTGSVYFKDELDNTNTKFLKIYNIDNTSPTIENVKTSRENNKINILVTANDINLKLNKEGSGVNGYAVTTSMTAPNDSDFQENSTLAVYKNGTYYIWVKDLVGNKTMYPKSINITEIENPITITSIWKDEDNKYNTRPEKINIKIYKDKVFYTEITINKNNTNIWKTTTEPFPIFNEKGEKCLYEIKEDENNSNLQYFYEEPIYDQPNLTVTNRATYVPVKPNEKLNYKVTFNKDIVNNFNNIYEEDFKKIDLDIDNIYNFKIILKELNKTVINTGTQLKEVYMGYSGNTYNVILNNKNSITLNNIPAGKYEISELSVRYFNFNDFVKTEGSSDFVKLTKENDKYFIEISGLTGKSENITVNTVNKINTFRLYDSKVEKINRFN